ncbi:hypothetical protein JWG44_15145 [Leptospira sp. 201903071]|uniref:LA_1064 family peroxide-responsive upregulated protein n=1 Tax=Leptospira ainazelensis TaxID=2810034 RepID=UPI001964ADD3|nr:hypothetical protein [Leptospira ainazelensis]MBM9501588.1 hypothetical protein [Leptospira ainazelensis]
MIWILVRETNIEIAGKETIRIELLPIAAFRSEEGLFSYCENKGWRRSRSGPETEFVRDMDTKQIKKRLQSYFSIEQPAKVYERFIIFKQDLMG